MAAEWYRDFFQGVVVDFWRLATSAEQTAAEVEFLVRELDIDAQVDFLDPQPARGFDSLVQAVEQLSGRLYVVPGSSEAARLEQILPGLLQEEDGVFRIRGAEPLRPAIVSWCPRHTWE